MLGVFGESAKQATSAWVSNLQSSEVMPTACRDLPGVPVGRSSIASSSEHAQHAVDGFEFMDIFVKNLGLFFWKSCSPVVFDRIAAEGTRAIVHGSSRRDRAGSIAKSRLQAIKFFRCKVDSAGISFGGQIKNERSEKRPCVKSTPPTGGHSVFPCFQDETRRYTRTPSLPKGFFPLQFEPARPI